MSEHNDPNLPDLSAICWHIQGEYGKAISDRVHKCLIACIGMSDEEVEGLPQIELANKLYREACLKDAEAMKGGVAKIKALKADLAEAVAIIKELRNVAGQSSPYHNDLANAFLDKHKEIQ